MKKITSVIIHEPNAGKKAHGRLIEEGFEPSSDDFKKGEPWIYDHKMEIRFSAIARFIGHEKVLIEYLVDTTDY